MILSSGVWFLSESMLKDKIFHVFVGVYAVFMGLFELFLLVFPVFRLEGMVSGSVALSWYRLSYYGEPLSVASLVGFLFFRCLRFLWLCLMLCRMRLVCWM